MRGPRGPVVLRDDGPAPTWESNEERATTAPVPTWVGAGAVGDKRQSVARTVRVAAMMRSSDGLTSS